MLVDLIKCICAPIIYIYCSRKCILIHNWESYTIYGATHYRCNKCEYDTNYYLY